MTVWAAIGLTAVGCYLVKLLGLSVPAGALERPLVRRGAVLLPVALLSALTALQTLGSDTGTLVLDARVVGVGAAVVALLLRAPFLVVIAVAVVVTAVARVFGG